MTHCAPVEADFSHNCITSGGQSSAEHVGRTISPWTLQCLQRSFVQAGLAEFRFGIPSAET